MGAALVLLLVGLGAMAAGVLIGRYYVPDDRQLRRTARHSKAYMRALSHLVARDHDTVITELRNVVEENVEDVEPYFALGAIFRGRGEHERAIRVHQALALRERDKRKLRQRAMYELGLDFRAAGMPRRATRAMEEVVVQEPNHEGALRALAALYEEQARFNEAAGLWQRLGRRRGEDTSHREHHLLVAAAQTALGRDDLDSAKQLLKAAQKHEESAHFFAAAAELAAARGNHRGAKERLKQALVAEPGLAPHLLPGLIAAEQGLARESSGDRDGADDLEDDGVFETAPPAPGARRALPETSSSGPRRPATQPLATVSSSAIPVTTGSDTASPAVHASTASASRATQVGIVAASASRAVNQQSPAGTPSANETTAMAAPGSPPLAGGSSSSSSPLIAGAGASPSSASFAAGSGSPSSPSMAGGSSSPSSSSTADGSSSPSNASIAEGSQSPSSASTADGSSSPSSPSTAGDSSAPSSPSMPGGSSSPSSPPTADGSSSPSSPSMASAAASPGSPPMIGDGQSLSSASMAGGGSSPSSAPLEEAGAAGLTSPRVSSPTEERAALGPAPPLESFSPAASSSPDRAPSTPPSSSLASSATASARGASLEEATAASTFEQTSLVRSPTGGAAQGTPSRSPTLPGIALVPAQLPSPSVADHVLAVLAEIEALSGPRLELALIRAQLVPPADTAGRAELAGSLTTQFPDALAARVATARLAIASGDPAAIRVALDALVSEGGALAWTLRGRWQCAHCGHRPGPFSWRCGQCRRWSTLRMETGVEPPPVPPRERRAAPRVARPEALLGASPDESLPTPTLDPGLSDSELATAGARRSLLGRVGGWVSSVWRRGA